MYLGFRSNDEKSCRIQRFQLLAVGNMNGFLQLSYDRSCIIIELLRSRLFLGLASVLLFSTPLFAQEDPSISFEKTTYKIEESDGNAVITIIRGGDTSQSITVEYITEDGTAIGGDDYEPVAGKLSFESGEEAKQLEVPILNDGLQERTETIMIRLFNPTDGAIFGSHQETKIRISDNDEGFRFAFPATEVNESQASVNIRVWRGDDLDQRASVTVKTVDGAALSGVDFQMVEETLEFGPEDAYRTINIPLINDSLIEKDERFSVELGLQSEGFSLGKQQQINCIIRDNDFGFEFTNTRYNVHEDAGEAVVAVVRRWDNLDFEATLEFATKSGTAVRDEDFVEISRQLVFAEGEIRKEIRIPIQNDGLAEEKETIGLSLTSLNSETPMAARTRATVNILDNDPGIQFQISRYAARENEGMVRFVVERGNDGELGAFDINYATENASATAGEDYVPISGTLEFAANETMKELTVALLEDDKKERNERFSLKLSSPNNEVTLNDSRSQVNVTIEDAGSGSFHFLAPAHDSGLKVIQERDLLVIQWEDKGMLQRADTPEGPWANVTGSQSPHRMRPVTKVSFFRVSHARPAMIYVPSSYEPMEPMPLVFALHGYGNDGQGVENYWNWLPEAEVRGFLYCYPDGSINSNGDRFWNASDACCNLDQAPVDDVSYLRGLVEAAREQFNVDSNKIYFAGTSNGGYMAHRMACEYSEVVAAIASQAGAAFFETDACIGTNPVNILQIHGTSDTVVSYEGDLSHSNIGLPYGPYPGAIRTGQNWAAINACKKYVANDQATLDLTTDVRGLDTRTARYFQCTGTAEVELWSIEGGSHVPTISGDFSGLVLEWLFKHPKKN
jgi:polyhydroxybutyrate depolymerase